MSENNLDRSKISLDQLELSSSAQKIGFCSEITTDIRVKTLFTQKTLGTLREFAYEPLRF